MVKVAIAGGTGDVGRTIVEVIQNDSQHEAIVLARKPSQEQLGAPIVVVDYTDVSSLTRTLEDNDIDTVICALGTSGDGVNEAQINLIKASDASSKTKRFVPSCFAISYPRDNRNPMFDGYNLAIDELKKSKSLKWTVVHNGIFLDYFAIGRIKSYLKPHPLIVDIEHRMAALPGSGDIPVTITYSFDMAKFLVAELDLDDWPEESRIAGDFITWNEFVRLAEEATGSKFEVTFDDEEKLKRSEITELPFQKIAYDFHPKEVFQAGSALFELMTLDRKMMTIPPEVNARFPNIQPMTVKKMLDCCWRAEKAE